MQTLSKFSCSLLRQAVVSSALAIPADLKDHSHDGGSLPLTLNLWLIVEFCHKTTSLPQAGFLPRRTTNCQTKQYTGGKLPFTPDSSHFQIPNGARSKEHQKKIQKYAFSTKPSQDVSHCSAREAQKYSSNSSSIINKCETIHWKIFKNKHWDQK